MVKPSRPVSLLVELSRKFSGTATDVWQNWHLMVLLCPSYSSGALQFGHSNEKRVGFSDMDVHPVFPFVVVITQLLLELIPRLQVYRIVLRMSIWIIEFFVCQAASLGRGELSVKTSRAVKTGANEGNYSFYVLLYEALEWTQSTILFRQFQVIHRQYVTQLLQCQQGLARYQLLWVNLTTLESIFPKE